MNGKSFISVYFSENQILLSTLDRSRKKVKKYAAATLPDGLIKNYKVTNVALLAKILGEIWKKLKIREKSVCIVIPEYSTFIKILKVSKIAISEINEALNWQLSEMLPYSLEEAVTDWKILKKEDKDYTILSVSIEKSILQTYLSAFEIADLYPVVVEIPSVALSRIFEGKNSQLVIYSSQQETFFILQDEGNLIGSSQIEGNDSSEVISTATRMLNHYKDTKVSRIMVCGAELPTTEKLKLPVEYFKRPFAGIADNEAQKYLIPLASQTVEFTDPNDPFSLNLIPTALISRYKAAKTKLQVWSMTLAVTLFVWISFLSTVTVFFVITTNTNQIKSKISQLTATNNSRQQYLAFAKEVNEASKKVKGIKDKTFPTTALLNQIETSKFEGLTIDSFKLDLELGSLSVVGIAKDRQSLVKFRDNLEKLEDFESPEIPVSSYEKETDLDFEVILKYGPAQVQKPKKEVQNVK